MEGEMRNNDATAWCEEQFRLMADAAPMMISACGSDGLATYFNQSWLTFTGRRLEQELGYGWTQGLHVDDRERALAAYRASTSARRNCHLEYRLRRADGEYRWISCSGAPWWLADATFAGYLACCIDTTDLRRAREQAFDEQKLESMRVLAGGIAHDLCNLLAVIQVQAEEVETEFAGGASPAAAITRLRSVATCATEIVRELMIYSEEDQTTLERIDLSRLIDEMLTLLRVSISKRAKLRTEMATGLPPVLGNKTQLRQVVMNLVINASEALAESEGTIRIAIAGAAAAVEAAGPTPATSPGEYLRIEISDTGSGMTDEIRNKIFERSFSTKPGARGMGLAAVQGIVQAHGGVVRVRSELGEGTTFDVLLPTASQITARGFRSSPASLMDAMATGSPAVLLVEKEDHLRTTISKTLRRAGFSVVSAPDDRVALDILRNHPMALDAVILDLTPGRSGLEVLKQVRLVRGRVPVILTGSGTQVEGHGAGPGLSFLPKPYRIDRLVRHLRKTIQPRIDCIDLHAAAGAGGWNGKRTEESAVNSKTIATTVASGTKEG
jgi:PAS domain S-box-containing protein